MINITKYDLENLDRFKEWWRNLDFDGYCINIDGSSYSTPCNVGESDKMIDIVIDSICTSLPYGSLSSVELIGEHDLLLKNNLGEIFNISFSSSNAINIVSGAEMISKDAMMLKMSEDLSSHYGLHFSSSNEIDFVIAKMFEAYSNAISDLIQKREE